jgi:hypothetical protein
VTIEGTPYTMTAPALLPTSGPSGGSNVIGAAGPGQMGLFTTKDQFGSTIVLGFTPSSTRVSCGASIPGIAGPACQTVLFGPSTAATIIGPHGGPRTQTTATRVLQGTLVATSCAPNGQNCVVVSSLVPTATAYGVVTYDAAVPGARPTGAALWGGVAVGALGVLGAVL